MRHSIFHGLALLAAWLLVTHAYSQDMWNGISVSSDFHAGAGTASNPYQIRTGAQLMYFVNQVNAGNTFAGKTVKMMNDIDLNGNDFSCSADFAGIFDGGQNDLRVKFNKAYHLFSSVSGTIRDFRLLSSFNDHDGYPHYSPVYLVSVLREGALIENCEYVIEDGYVYGYTTTFVDGNFGTLRNCYATGSYRSYGAGSYVRNGQVGMLVSNNRATGIVENCKGDTYKSGRNYEGALLPLVTNNQGTIIEGEYVSTFITPAECTVEFIDMMFNQDFPSRTVSNGQVVGELPTARDNWTLTGWMRGGKKVNPTDTVQDNWTLFARWEQVIRRQPTRMDMTVDVDDIDNARFQWYSLAEDTTHIEGWVSPGISDGETTTKELTFNAESGQSLIIKYDLSSEEDADYFKVYLNGQLALETSGSRNGQFQTPIIESGENTLTLSYTKDESWNSGRDNVIVSDIMIVNVGKQVNCKTSTLPADFISPDSAYFCGISYTNSNTILYTDTIDFRSGTHDVGDTDISQLDNTVYFPAAEGLVGTQTTLSLQMKNVVQVTGFQCDLYLPEGISVNKDSQGFYDVYLSNERTTSAKTNIFDCALQTDGSLRIICSSTKSFAFSGNSGEVATVVLQLSENLNVGDYPVILRNIVISDKNSNTYEVDCVKSTLTIADYTPGDVNNDRKVNVGDITGIANYILGNTPANFVTKAADVNMDGNINVGDITGIANLILYGAVKPAQVRSLQRVNVYDDGSNTISIDDVTVAQGERQTLSVCLKNTVVACGLQFDLYLPEGIIIPQDEDGLYLVSLGNRTSAAKTNIFECAVQPDGAYRVLMGSTKSAAFTGSDGTICAITIEADANATVGTQLVEARNIFVSDTNSDTYETTSCTFRLTVTEPSDTYVVLDENSTTVPAAATNVDVRVKRTIKANEWSTICLPFAMSEAQVKETFGEDVDLADFDGTDSEFDGDDCVGIRANFTSVNAIEANHPYIIKVSQPISEFTLDDVDIVADEDEAYIEFDNGKTGSRRVVYSGFYGTYHAGTALDEFTLFLSDNKFWYSKGQTKMKAFRAYFEFLDVLTDVKNSSNVKLWVRPDVEDGLPNLRVENDLSSPAYNLAGQRVGKSYKGVVIENGRKIVK